MCTIHWKIGFIFTLICVVEAPLSNILLNVLNSNASIRSKWTDDYIMSNIDVRLVKRTWHPSTNPKKMKNVLDQAPYEVEDAYRLLRHCPLYEFESQPLTKAENLFMDGSPYDPSKETIVVIHTISQDGDENFVKTTIAALGLRNFHIHYNVFAVHMPTLEDFMATTIKRVLLGFHNQYQTLGRIIAGFLKKGIAMGKLKPGQINLIGFCFSAQLSGYIARDLPGTIKSIIALDPYSMGFWRYSMQHVSRSDALVVQSYHTSSLLQGTTRRIGTADFIFNKGFLQPGCSRKGMDCSHQRVAPLFWYIILFSNRFIARECHNYFLFRFCWCENKQSVRIHYPPDPKVVGTFYISTTAHRPFGLGASGGTCKQDAAPMSFYHHVDEDDEPYIPFTIE